MLWALLGEIDTYRALLGSLNAVRHTNEVYDRIYIADAHSGTIFLSTDESELGIDITSQSFFKGALKTRDEYLGDITQGSQNQRAVLHISHVIKNQAGGVVAVLVVEINADEIILPMLHTGEGLGKSGEALLVNQEGKILTSLKHPLPDGSSAKPLQYTITAKPAMLAARGEEGIIEDLDYRDEPVLAAYRHIRLSSKVGWGMVVKRDQAELYAPLRQDVTYSILISFFAVIAIIGLTVIFSRTLTQPLKVLRLTARRVEAGDLSARAQVTTSDEVGDLASILQRHG